MTALWALVDALAAQLAESKHVARFRDGIKPVPCSRPEDGFAVNSVHDLLAHYSMLQSQPLLLGMRVPHLPEFRPLYSGSTGVRGWLDSAQRVAFAFADIVEFLRSRLPGYPMLLVPDLLPGATRVRHDGVWDMGFPWLAQVRRAGLQLKNRPDMPRALELQEGAGLNETLGDLLRALGQTTAWERFAAADLALDADARAAAKELRRRYREAVMDERVDAIAGDTGMRGAVMRRAELAAIKDTATGTLGEYYDAFDAVDELLECVTALITHRLARGDLQTVQVISADFGPPTEARTVWLRARDDAFRTPYELVRISSAVPALAGAVVLHGLTIHMDDDLLVADGRLLTGSSGLSVQL